MCNRLIVSIKFALLSLVCLVGMADAVRAEDWAFRRSYYTHDLSHPALAHAPVPHYRSAYRIPYIPNTPGGSVYSTWRINRVQLRSGSNVDTEFIYRGSVDFRP